MTTSPEQRKGADRRRQPRGGRRPEDPAGFAPLVMVVGDEPATATLAEALLAKLYFAVTTCFSVEQALHILPSLRPDIVIAGAADADRIRGGSAAAQPTVIEMTDAMRQDPHVLIEEMRRVLREHPPG